MVFIRKGGLLLIFLIVNGLAVLGWAVDPLIINIKTEQSEITFNNHNNQQSIAIEDGATLEITGAPSIPYKIINIALPSETVLENISATGNDTSTIATGLDYPWYRGDIRTDNDLSSQVDKRNQEIYNSSGYYPGGYFQISNQGKFGGQPIISLAIYPVQIKPVSGELILIRDIRLQINLIDDLSCLSGAGIAGSEIIRATIYNPEQLNNSPNLSKSLGLGGIPGTNPMGLGAEYLVITSTELAGAFYPYVVWKNQKGLLTELVIIDDILAYYSGVDDAAKLRAYLQEAHTAGANWALLGGDEDIIPIRYAYQANVSKAPHLADQQICDLYYGDLTGNWDFDGDGVYGEMTHDQPDLLPEIYIGRIPAENAEEAQIWVEKALLYEQNPGHGDYSYLTKALIISADQMRDLDEHLDLALAMPPDFLVDYARCAEEPGGSANSPTQPIAETVISIMNEGWGFVTNLNHGNFYAYSSMSPNYNSAPRSYVWGDTLNIGDGASSLTHLAESDKYSIYYSFSCEVAAFDFDKEVVRPGPFITDHTFMEAYLFRPNRAGVAFLGNTRWGWVSASFRLEQKFLELVFSDSARSLGVAEALSKVFYPNYRDIDYGHNLFGDPEMTIWRETPTPLSVLAPAEIDIDSPSFTVFVNAVGGPADGVNVCIWKPGELYFRGLTDNAGMIVVPISLTEGGQIYVAATAIDYVPAIDTIFIHEHVDIDDPQSKPGKFYLDNAYPNPFNSTTTIKFGLGDDSYIKLDVFDLGGRKVNALANGDFPAGEHQLKWDGRNEQGESVSSGIYIYRIDTGSKVSARKMVLLK